MGKYGLKSGSDAVTPAAGTYIMTFIGGKIGTKKIYQSEEMEPCFRLFWKGLAPALEGQPGEEGEDVECFVSAQTSNRYSVKSALNKSFLSLMSGQTKEAIQAMSEDDIDYLIDSLKGKQFNVVVGLWKNGQGANAIMAMALAKPREVKSGLESLPDAKPAPRANTGLTDEAKQRLAKAQGRSIGVTPVTTPLADDLAPPPIDDDDLPF